MLQIYLLSYKYFEDCVDLDAMLISLVNLCSVLYNNIFCY